MEESAALSFLYQGYDTLSNGDAQAHADVFAEMLTASRLSTRTKILGMKLLPPFFKYFHQMDTEIFTFLLDNTEENDPLISKPAATALCDAAVSLPSIHGQLALALCQMLIRDCETELAIGGLCKLLQLNPETTCKAIFTLLETSAQDSILEFVKKHVVGNAKTLLHENPSLEQQIAAEIAKLMPTAFPKEFKVFMSLLLSLKSFRTGKDGAQQLLDIAQKFIGTNGQNIAAKLDDSNVKRLEGDSCPPADAFYVECVGVFLNQLSAMLHHGASSEPCISFIAEELLPALPTFPSAEQLSVLEAASSVSRYAVGPGAKALLAPLLHTFRRLVPVADAQTVTQLDVFKFECLLFMFHCCAAKAKGHLHALYGYRIVTGQPSDLLEEDHTAELQAFHAILKVIVATAKAHQGSETSKEVSAKLNVCVENIITMVRPLIASPPSFLESGKGIVWSWQQNNKAAGKRQHEADSTSGKRNAVQLYVPPAKQNRANPQGKQQQQQQQQAANNKQQNKNQKQKQKQNKK